MLSAGHCSSVTGAAVASPAAYPPQVINLRIGGTRSGEGEQVPAKSVTVHPNYLVNAGYDISIIKLTRLWAPSTMETIAGWGTTSEGGRAPSVLQEAQVPITTDDYCSGAYDDFESTTMVCAGFPQGGVDTCQGDSGGPMFGRAATGELRVVGATSYGEGCARAGKPGVYAHVGDTTLREWIRGQSPAGVN